MIFKILIALVALAPLPFASVYPWSTSLMALVVGILLVAWRIELVMKGRAPAFGLRSTWPFMALFSITVIWAAIQAFKGGPSGWYNPMWPKASEALGRPLDGAISVNPEATLSALMGLLTYGGVFFLSLQYCRRTENARRVVKAVAVAGFVYAVYGLWVQISGSRTILWYNKFAYFDDLTSTFVNRNSYATYAGLGLVCLTGLIVNILSNAMAKPFGRVERRQIIEVIFEQGWFLLVGWVVVMTALILTHSRAGFLSTVLALIVLSLLLSMSKGVRVRYAVILSGLSVILVGLLFSFSGEGLDQRLGSLFTSNDSRMTVYRLTVGAIGEYPWQGTGYGTFAEVFQSFRSPELYKEFLKAHNTYLENTLELGIPAAAALFGVFIGFLVVTLHGVRTRRRSILYPSIGFAATVLVGVHSLVDFSLQIPALAVTYSLLMGAACAQSRSSKEPRDPY